MVVGGATITFPKGAVTAPLNVTISVQDASTAPAEFVVLNGTIDGTTMVGTVKHFSSGFVGRKK